MIPDVPTGAKERRRRRRPRVSLTLTQLARKQPQNSTTSDDQSLTLFGSAHTLAEVLPTKATEARQRIRVRTVGDIARLGARRYPDKTRSRWVTCV